MYLFKHFNHVCCVSGVIEGSEKSLTSPGRVLDRATYESRRSAPVDYALFERYLSLKKKYGELDVSDRQGFYRGTTEDLYAKVRSTLQNACVASSTGRSRNTRTKRG